MKPDQKTIVFGAATLSVGLIICTIIGAMTVYGIRSLNDSLSVTGSAKKSVVSDQVKWTSSFSRQVYASSLNSGYDQMSADLNAVKKFFASKGIDEKSLSISPVFMDEIYNYNKEGIEYPKQYRLRQQVELNSTDIAKITEISKNIQPLIQSGILFSTQSLEYSYSKLADLRVELLSSAIADARARAVQMTSGTGKSVGKLKSASSGVVQVLSVNSTDVSDYGSYNTQDINKDVMVTVKAAFQIK